MSPEAPTSAITIHNDIVLSPQQHTIVLETLEALRDIIEAAGKDPDQVALLVVLGERGPELGMAGSALGYDVGQFALMRYARWKFAAARASSALAR